MTQQGLRRGTVWRSSQWSDLSVVQLAVHVDLPLCDVARQIRDGMGDVCGGEEPSRESALQTQPLPPHPHGGLPC